MKRINLLLLTLLAVVVYACSTNGSDQVSDANGVKVTRSVVQDADEAKCTAKIAVDGMSCSKMCTGAIAGCLKKMEGVKATEIYFDPERKAEDFATIEYDEKKITEKEMIAAIEKLNDGQYKVKSVEIIVTAFNNIGNIAIPGILAVLETIIQ